MVAGARLHAERSYAPGVTAQRPPRLLAPDALRALATVFVIVIHTTHWFGGQFYYDLDLLARFAVPAFVVLTGLLLAYMYPPERMRVGSFLHRRFSRSLLPWMVWAPFFILFGIILSGDPKANLGAVWVFVYWGAGHLWFLLLIPQLYLVYLVWPRRALPAAVIALLLQTGFCFYRFFGPVPDGALNALVRDHAAQLFPYWIGYFGIGIAAGQWLRTHGESRTAHPRAVALTSAAVIGTGFLQVVRWPVGESLQSGTGAFLLPQEPIFVVSIAVLVFLVGPGILARGGRFAQAMQSISDNSLGIYILHPLFVFALGSHLLHGLLPFSGDPFPSTLPGFLILTAGGLVGAWIAARLISATPLAPIIGAPRRPLISSGRAMSGAAAAG